MSTDLHGDRRARLMQTIGPRAIAIFRTGPEAHRNGDVHYKYRASSDVVYLTGFVEPETVVVLAPGREQPFTLFVRPRDREREIWNGRRAGVEGATAKFGASAAFPVGELRDRLPKLLDGADEVWFALGDDAGFDADLVRMVGEVRSRERRGTRAPRRFVDPRDALAEQRLYKSPAELEIMRRAAEITAAAHTAAMQRCRPGMREYELEAEIEYVFRQRGAFGPGYPTIVGAGDNATILHYIENEAVIRDGDLVLIDAGAEVDFYTADVTRTFPAGGRFSAPQRRLYDLVLRAELEAIAMCRVGQNMDTIHDRAAHVLIEGLVALGILTGEIAKLHEDGALKRYYMHRTSHWLGMDVHDAGPYMLPDTPRTPGQLVPARPLEPGMVLTIEPGLYISADDETAPAEYRGIGIRIEDDIVVTDGDPEVLTAAAPKDPDLLEKLTSHA